MDLALPFESDPLNTITYLNDETTYLLTETETVFDLTCYL